MNVPYDADAELALLGSVLLYPSRFITLALSALTPADFYVVAHQHLFSVIAVLHDNGTALEYVPLAAELRRLEQSEVIILEAQNAGTSVIDGTLAVVLEMSLRRRLLKEGLELQKGALDLKVAPAGLLDGSRESLASMRTGVATADDEDWDEFLARASAKPTPWVIHGLLREGWRTVVVAEEGWGKTWLLRQFAVCAAYGIQPLRFTLIPPVRTLLVDLENPVDHIHHSLDRLVKQAKTVSNIDSGSKRLWRRPGGVDLRKRADRAELEAILVKHRPQLLVLGPLYKAYRASGSETSWEFAARDMQAILDDWRDRFNLAMFIEDHAGKAGHGKDAELQPYGSSLWLRWPELGLGLYRQPAKALKVGRWRGDRVVVDWPDRLERDGTWPWTGRWGDDGPGSNGKTPKTPVRVHEPTLDLEEEEPF